MTLGVRLIRMALSGCIWGELRGYLTFGVPVRGLGHDWEEQEDGSLWCPKCRTQNAYEHCRSIQ